MHMGETSGADTARPLLRFDDGRSDGATSASGAISGTYVHGLFTDDRQRAAFLRRCGAAVSAHRHDAAIEATLDALAAHLEAHTDIDRMLSLARSAGR
jgi:adenosylcobyric acid synthase